MMYAPADAPMIGKAQCPGLPISLEGSFALKPQ